MQCGTKSSEVLHYKSEGHGRQTRDTPRSPTPPICFISAGSRPSYAPSNTSALTRPTASGISTPRWFISQPS